MPIQFTCPHCAKQMTVPDEFAGQSGPCRACGQSIVIPGKPTNYAPPVKSTGGLGLTVIVIGLVVMGILFVGCIGALLIPATQVTREAARRSQSMGNLKQIAIALHYYHDANQSFPPAVVRDANGRPLYSGRVLLLPYLEMGDLYNQWDKDAAWDSPANWSLSQQSVKVFHDPSAPNQESSLTDYLFLVGAGSAFEDLPSGMRFRDFVDGTSNTIIVLEVKGSTTNWAEPLELDIANFSPQEGNHPGGMLAAFMDGSVHFLSEDIDPAVLKALTTRNGGEPIDSGAY